MRSLKVRSVMIGLPAEIEGKYEILEKMGEGGMGSVFKVRHRFLEEIQVIKVMQSKFQTDPELKTRFLREAKTAKQVRHPNIAEVIDYSVANDGTAYIVMEFIQGVNLRQLQSTQKQPFPYPFVLEVGVQALAALGYLHRKGFVHRDISPDNLMLTKDQDGQPLIKLIDLGIAKSIEGTQNLTMAGRFVGKVQYASPEQLSGADGDTKIDARSDLYSFGIVLYQLLTGTPPVSGTDYLAIITNKLTRPPRSFDETDPQGKVPLRLRDIVTKSLARSPADRFQTAQEFSRALEALVEVTNGPTKQVYFPMDELTQVGAPTATSAAEQDDWDAAVARGTITAWEEYLSRHVNSPRADRAREQLERLEAIEEQDWNAAAQTENIDTWREYLRKHSGSSRASKAKRRLEKLEAQAAESLNFESANRSDSVTGWQMFLRQYPRSARAADAQAALARAEQRRARETAWTDALNKNAVETWRAFLKAYPDSEHASEARKRLDQAEKKESEDREWRAAEVADSSEAWKSFIARFPNSDRVTDAREALERVEARDLEERAWRSAASVESAAGWRAYLGKHAASARAGEARARLASAEARESEERDWNAALNEDSTLRTFLTKHPSGTHAAEAIRKLAAAESAKNEKRDWDAATAAGSSAAWRDYISRHGKSARVGEARQRFTEAQQREAEELQARKREEEEREKQRRAAEKREAEQREAEKREAKRLETEKREAARKEAERLEAEKREAKRLEAEKRETEKREQEQRKREADAAKKLAAEASPTVLVPKLDRTMVEELRQAEPEPEPTVLQVLQPSQRPSTRETAGRTLVEETPRTVIEDIKPPRLSRPAAIAASVIVVIAVGVGVLVSRNGEKTTGTDGKTDTVTEGDGKDDPPPPPPPGPTAGGSDSSGTNIVVVAGGGELVLNAVPWAEIESIRSTPGNQEQLKGAAFTPLTLTLPPGDYSVRFKSASGRRLSLPVKVAEGRRATLAPELDRVDPDQYVRDVVTPR